VSDVRKRANPRGGGQVALGIVASRSHVLDRSAAKHSDSSPWACLWIVIMVARLVAKTLSHTWDESGFVRRCGHSVSHYCWSGHRSCVYMRTAG
jgi:hypothetical protein